MKALATQRVQFLDYKLIRSGVFSYKELGVLEYINSFSQFCAPERMEIMASQLHMSVRTLRNIITRLIQKGIILKRYRAFKRIRLELVSLAEQARITGTSMVRNIMKPLKKVYDRQKQSLLDRQKEPRPIEKLNLKKKTSNTDEIFQRKMTEQEFHAHRDAEVLRFKAAFGLI